MKVRPPSTEANHPEYRLECEQALDLAVREVVDMAIATGWKPEAVFLALTNVTATQRAEYRADPDPADDVA